MATSSKIIWLTLLLVVLLVAVASVSYQLWQKNEESAQETELNRNLGKRIDELQRNIQTLRLQEDRRLAKQTELNTKLIGQIERLQKEIEKLETSHIIKDKIVETQDSKVTTNVDKMDYDYGEKIKVTINNDSKESIFSHIGSGTPVFAIKYIQRKTVEREWESFFAQGQPPNVFYDIDAPTEIKPGESASFEWKPLIFINGTSETEPLNSGEYRLVILYEDSQKAEWRSIYTNEFRIR